MPTVLLCTFRTVQYSVCLRLRSPCLLLLAPHLRGRVDHWSLTLHHPPSGLRAGHGGVLELEGQEASFVAGRVHLMKSINSEEQKQDGAVRKTTYLLCSLYEISWNIINE